MKKKLLALALAAIMACSLLAPPALAAEAELACEVRPDGGVEVTVPAVTLSGSGVVQVATYSAQGRLMDFKTATVDDLAQGYHGILSARTEPGGSCKAFLLGGEGYRPLTENAQVETKGPAKLLATVTKGAKFASSSSIWNNRADSYVGVDCETDENGYAAPGKVTYYINGRNIGSRAVDAQPGDIARIYDTDGNGKADAVIIAQYHVTQLTGNVSTEGDRVSIPRVTGGFVPADWINGPSDELKKGDVILWCFEDGAEPTYTIERPETVTGKVSAVNNKRQIKLIGGDRYYDHTGIIGGSMCNENHFYSWMDFENEYTFYLDKNGGICYYTRNTNVIGGPWAHPIKGGLVFRMDESWRLRPTGGYCINIVDSMNGSLTELAVSSLECADEPLTMYTVDNTIDVTIDGSTHETVTDMTKITQSDPDKGITVGELMAIGYSVVTFEGGRAFLYDEETFCVVIDLKTDPATGKTVYYNSGAFDPEDLDTDPELYGEELKLYVLEDESDREYADYIYVVRTLKAN